MKRWRALIVLGITAFISVGGGMAASVRAEGIGVYPTSLRFADALRGGEYQATVGVLNRADEDRVFTLRGEGPIGDWFTFSDLEGDGFVSQIDAPANGEARATVTVAIPDDAANGTYAGAVMVDATVPGDDSSGASAVGVSVEIAVEVVVTGTQHLEARLLAVRVPPVEVGMPVRIQAELENSGNVQVEPVVTVAIVDEAGVSAASVEATAPVRPQSQRTIEATWDTARAFAGEYQATVTVGIPGVDTQPRTINFMLAEVGTFTRNGEFLELHLANDPQPGLAARLVAVFQNTGEIETQATFVGEILRDGVLLAPVQTVASRVTPGVAEELEVLVEIPTAGDYTVRGHVNYEGKETPIREFAFTVRPAASDSGGGWGAGATGVGAGIASLVALSIGAVVLWKRRGEGITRTAVQASRAERRRARRSSQPQNSPGASLAIDDYFDQMEQEGRHLDRK